MPPIFLSEDELQHMLKAATFGEPYTPSSQYAERVFASIKREVAEIKAKGGIVEVSSGLP